MKVLVKPTARTMRMAEFAPPSSSGGFSRYVQTGIFLHCVVEGRIRLIRIGVERP